MTIEQVGALADRIAENIGLAVFGKPKEIRLVLAVMLAGGHVLLEDVPGTGKTVLAKTVAKSVDCLFGRVQFTPDLLPSELTGINIYSPKTGDFSFRKGSLFTNILLADEINRATPRTQSGLLESMEELQITVDSVTYTLPRPYFVIATQNPVETQGTFPLPEAQLDRFMVKLSLGYPDQIESAAVLRRYITGEPMKEIFPVCGADELLAACEAVRTVYIHPEIYLYIVKLAQATREHEAVALGISTRGCLALARLAQAGAAMQRRSYVTPDDVKPLVPCVFGHRLIFRGSRHSSGVNDVIEKVLADVSVPVEQWPGLR